MFMTASMATMSDHHHHHQRVHSTADITRPFQKQSYGSSNRDRPLSDLINLPPLASKLQRTNRPTSDIVQAANIYRHSLSPEGSFVFFVNIINLDPW